MTEVEFHAGLQAPFQRHLVDGPRTLAAIHGGMKVPGRVEMGTVMGGELDLFDGPALSVRQIFRLQSIEELQHARQSLLVIDVLDGRMVARRIGRNVVLQWHGNVDQLSRHRAFSFGLSVQATTFNSFAAVWPRMSAFSLSLSEAVARMGSTGCISQG